MLSIRSVNGLRRILASTVRARNLKIRHTSPAFDLAEDGSFFEFRESWDVELPSLGGKDEVSKHPDAKVASPDSGTSAGTLTRRRRNL